MRIYRTGIVVAVALIAALAVVACGGSDSKTVKVPGGEGKVSNKLPGNFPDDLPIYKGADLQGSYSGKAGGVEGILATWSIKDSVEKVKGYYEEQLDGRGAWKSDASGDTGGSSFFTAKNKDASKVAYVLISKGDGDDKTTLVITAGDNQDSASNDGASLGGGGTDVSEDATDTPSDGGAPDATLPDEAKLASDFPKDQVPLPSGVRVTGSTSFSQGEAKTYSVELYSKDDVETIAKFFKTELEKKGWKESLASNSNGEVFATYLREDSATTGANDSVTVTIAKADVSGYSLVNVLVSVSGT